MPEDQNQNNQGFNSQDQTNQQYNQYQMPTNNYNPSSGSGAGNGGNGGNMPNHGLYLALSIIMIFFNLICGVIACIFTSGANTAYKDGDIDTANSKKNVAKITLIIGAVISVITIVITGVTLHTVYKQVWKPLISAETNALNNMTSDGTLSYTGTDDSDINVPYTDTDNDSKINVTPESSSPYSYTDEDEESYADATVSEPATEMAPTTDSATSSSADGVTIKDFKSDDFTATGINVLSNGEAGYSCVYLIQNNTSKTLGVEGTITYYDASGAVIGTKDVSVSAIAANAVDYDYDFCDKQFTTATIDLKTKDANYSHPATLKTEVSQLTSTGVTLKITNYGAKACDAPYAIAMFGDSKHCTEVETAFTDVETLAPGESTTVDISSYSYDSTPYTACIAVAHASEQY